MRPQISAALFSPLALNSCLQREPTEAEMGAVEATLVIRADPAGTGVATVVHVTAPDIATPLVFNIPKGELASECYCPANPAAQEAELCTPQFGAAYTIF